MWNAQHERHCRESGLVLPTFVTPVSSPSFGFSQMQRVADMAAAWPVLHIVLKVLCGWLLHCKRFSAISERFVSTVVCPACLCSTFKILLALMVSASEDPNGLTTSKGR